MFAVQHSWTRKVVAAAVILFAASSVSFAQYMHDPAQEKGAKAGIKPAELQNIGIDQRLGEQLPLDVPFKDEAGNAVMLRDYFHAGRPVLLNFVYYDCPMLCGEVLNGVAAALKTMKFTPGKEFEVVTISIDPREKPALAAAKKENYMIRYGRPQAAKGWHFLTGEQPQIEAVTKAAGWKYAWDPRIGQFAHAAGIMLVTPEGKLAQYYYGIEYSARDLRLGIVESSQNKVGSIADQVLLYCYHYDPQTGKYGAIAMNIMRLSGAVTALMLGGFLVLMFRREAHDKRYGTGRA